MHDETKPQADETPASHEHMNRPGVTNGVPDQAAAGDATGLPDNDRQDAETAASDTGSGS